MNKQSVPPFDCQAFSRHPQKGQNSPAMRFSKVFAVKTSSSGRIAARSCKAVGILTLLLIASVGAGAATSGTIVDSTMVWNGITRYYEVYIPASHPTNP